MAKKQYSRVTPANADPGLSRYFEVRPELAFGIAVPRVHDASRALGKRKVDGVYVASQLDVVCEPCTTVGFGTPNAFLLVPDIEGTGHDKFSAFSFHRAPAQIAPSSKTHELFQAGLQVIIRNAPAQAVLELRAAMALLVGRTFKTCVRAVLTALEDAGFTAGDQPLSSYTLPAHAMMAIMRHGLSWRGQKLDLYFVRTGHAASTEGHALRVMRSELHTLSRHGRKSLTPRAKGGSRTARALLWLLDNPVYPLSALSALVIYLTGSLWLGVPLVLITTYYLLRHVFGTSEEAQPAPMAEGLPRAGNYETVNVSVSQPSAVGVFFRWLWGSHALFSVSTPRVNISKYLPNTLKPFPQKKPSFGTRVKKKYLFRPIVIKFMRRFLCPAFTPVGDANERDVFSMLRTHSEKSPNKYNLACTGSENEWTLAVARIDLGESFLSRIGLGFIARLIDWILSKHVLMTGYADCVPFCGEGWKREDGVICLSGNSGTYQPTDEELDAFILFCRETFPHLQFAKIDRDGNEVPATVAS
jgi:hypothetical protein